MSGRWLPVLTACLVVLGAAESRAAAPQVAEFFERTCRECHDAQTREGGLDLSSLPFDPATPENFARWVLIFDRVSKGEMPPKDNPRPAPADVERFSRELSTSLLTAERELLGSEGRALRRRMNRYEYESTLRDLLEVPVLEIRDFLPEDRVAFGFNKVGDALDVSHVQLSRYLTASEFALRQAMAPQVDRPAVMLQRYYTWDMPGFRKGAGPSIRMTHRIYDMKIAPPARGGRRGNAAPPPTNPDGTPHDREKEAVALMMSTYEPSEIQYNRFRAPMTAKYRLRFSGYSIWMAPDFLTVAPGRGPEPITIYSDRTPGLFRKLFSYNVGTTPTVVEQEVWLIAGETIRPDAPRLVRTRPPDFRNPLAEPDGMPGVAWQWMEVEGPLFDEWPPASHQRMFGELALAAPAENSSPPATNQETNQGLSAIGLRSFQGPRGVNVMSEHPDEDAARLVKRFMEHVFRHPSAEEDVQDFVGIARRALAAGHSFTDAMIATYTGILSSPAFVFFDVAPGKLSDRALADRLAYFLWNTRPDDELLRLASEGILHRPDVLRQQTNRLLDDPRSSQFFNAFLDYWLDLRWIAQTSPDVEMYPEYDLDDLLIESAVDETRLFFRELVQRNLGVANVIDSDFTFLNNRLALHYGIAGVDGIEMRRTPLPEDHVRGGFLTQAAILKVTANGTTTSPVLRGAWVMSRLLGKTPPPPPAAVPAVQPDTRGATTIREQLDKHRADVSCNVCHRHIDPAGFALENFDVVGAWRDRYRSLGEGDRVQGVGHNGNRFRYRLAKAVDSSGVLVDGQSFQDVRQFQSCLLRDPEQLARNLVHQLTTYATGAPIRFSDRGAIAGILEHSRQDGYGLRTMIHEIIQSEMFLHK